MEAATVGIDLGTTFSCIAVFKDGKATVIPLEDGSNTMASVVSFDETEGRKIGDKAKIESILDPTNTIIGVKRYIGCRYDDVEVQENIDTYLYNIIDFNGQPRITISLNANKTTFTPEEISAMILEKLKDYATDHLKTPVTKAVITVPANFKDSQRQATQDAGKIAGLEVLRIINEPTAAALAYGIDDKYKSDRSDRHIVVYDFGGGTFDVSILSYAFGVLEVKATNGDNNLGGDDIDSILMRYFSNEFEDKYGIDITNESRALRRLRMQCERVKKELSSASTANIDIVDLHQSHDFYASITRETLEELCDIIFRKTLVCIDDALQQANLQKDDIDDILLVGGTTRIPKIRNMLQEFFNGKYIDTSLNPMEAVAIGAAVQAAILDGYDSGITGVLLLLDVAPLSLGVKIAGGVMSVIVPRNTQIPFKQTKCYSNEKDNQTRVNIIVYEGERILTADNNKLGEFMLSGLKPKPRGKSEIFVTFEVDTNGVLSVTAEEATDTGSNTLTIEIEKGRLTESEIANMIKKAQEMKAYDENKKAIILAKASLENYCIDHIKQANTVVQEEQEKSTVLNKCQTTLKWLKEVSDGSKEEYDLKRKELHDSLIPIIKKYS